MCTLIDWRIREFALQGQYKAESLFIPRNIYDVLQGMSDEDEVKRMVANLAFLCAKLGCENEADLAYLLDVPEDELHDFVSRANIKIEGLAQYWENL